MRYWIFQDSKVSGPYSPEDLASGPEFGADTLVCPEGASGKSLEHWRRLSAVPELAQLPLPPALRPRWHDSSVRELAAFASLQERVILLNNTVSRLQQTLKLKEQELASMRQELDDRQRAADLAGDKLRAAEDDLAAVQKIRQRLDRAMAQESALDGIVKRQASMIEGLRKEVDSLRAQQAAIEALKAEVAGLRKDNEAARAELAERVAATASLAEDAQKTAAELTGRPKPGPVPAPVEPQPPTADLELTPLEPAAPPKLQAPVPEPERLPAAVPIQIASEKESVKTAAPAPSTASIDPPAAPPRAEGLEGALERAGLPLMLAAVLLGFVYPQLGTSLRQVSFLGADLLTAALALLVFCAAPICSRKDFRLLLATPRTLAAALGMSYLALPLTALLSHALLGRLLPGETGHQLGIGLMLIAAAPMTVAASRWLASTRADLSSAAALYALTSALAPLTMPLLIGLMTSLTARPGDAPHGTALAVPILGVWLPLAAAFALRRAAPKAKAAFALAGTASLLLVLLMLSSAASALIKTRMTPGGLLMALGAVLAMSAVNSSWGYLVGGPMGLPRVDKVTLTFLVPMRSNGLAMAAALTAFSGHPLAAVPAGLGVLQHLVAGLARWWLVEIKKVTLREFERCYVDGLVAECAGRHAVVDNVDQEGVCLVTDKPVPVGDIVDLKLSHEKGGVEPVTLKAVSTWNQAVVEGEDRSIGGFRFLNLRRDWKERFALFVQSKGNG